MSKHAKIESNDDSTSEIGQPLPSASNTPEAVAPIDLPTADVASVTGGGDGGTYGGSLRLNHNEPTEADKDEANPVLPADLPVAEETSGTACGGSGPSSYGGSTRLNHNEPIAADNSED